MKEEGLPLVCEEEQGSLAEDEVELEGEERAISFYLILSYLTSSYLIISCLILSFLLSKVRRGQSRQVTCRRQRATLGGILGATSHMPTS